MDLHLVNGHTDLIFVYEFDGVKINFDKPTKKGTKEYVMDIFYEEQPITWKMYKDEIKSILLKANGRIDFLEVGCGSGLWSILFKKHFGGNVLAIDKNQRAVKLTANNARLNNLDFLTRKEAYNNSTASSNEVKIIYINPPFHIYPEQLENRIPLFARGGWDGQGEFKSQLNYANYDLAPNGAIIFIMMCLGDDKYPNYLKYFHNIMDKRKSIFYTNLFEPISTYDFLVNIYGKDYPEFVEKVSKDYSKLYYTNGIIINDGLGKIEQRDKKIDLKPRTWQDRINLHFKINSI